MNYEALLLGAQVAGIGANLYAARNERRMTEAGLSIEQGELGLRQKQEQLAFTEANIASIEQLQEVLATQRAMAGARGVNPGVGSALAASNKSVRAQGADERARGLSNLFRKSQLDGMSKLLNIKKATSRAQYGNTMLGAGLNSFSLNTTIGDFINSSKTSNVPSNKPASKGRYSVKGSING